MPHNNRIESNRYDGNVSIHFTFSGSVSLESFCPHEVVTVAEYVEEIAVCLIWFETRDFYYPK